MIVLPIKVWDGETKRTCTYDDLFIITQLSLSYKLYAKRKWYKLRREKVDSKIINLVYAAITIALSWKYEYNDFGYAINIMKNRKLCYLECEDLHNHKNSSLIKLLLYMSKNGMLE